jgi:hypothetical protein
VSEKENRIALANRIRLLLPDSAAQRLGIHQSA